MRFQVVSLLFAATSCLADANPAPTPAPQLHGRAADPTVIGFLSASGGSYSTPQSCDYPATASTSGNYVQCCAASSACNFWTSCSGNNLMGASTSYACETGICNTAILLPTAGANGGKSDLGCWATNFGSSAFTLIQDIGTAAVVPAATSTGSASARSTGSASASGSSAASSASGSASGSQSSAAGGSSAAAGAASTSSRGGAAAIENELGAGGLIAAALAFVQALL